MKSEKTVYEININDLLPNRFQPRIKFNETAIKELSASIKEHGVIQPIVVRKIGDKYEIIAGERRYKASIMAGKNSIPAIVANLDDVESAEIALIENVQRQDLTPIEEAISYKKILDMGYTQAKLAEKLGNKQSTIANKLRLLNLTEEVQEALLDEKISERHARSLLKIEDPSQQIEMLERIINERLTVRKADEEIDKMFSRLFKKKEKEQPVEVPVVNKDEIPVEVNPLPNAEELSVNVPLEPIAPVPLEEFSPVPTIPLEPVMPVMEDNQDDNDFVSGNFFGITNDNVKVEPVPLENVPSIDTAEKVEIPAIPTPSIPSFEQLFNKPTPVPTVDNQIETTKIEDLPIFNQPEIKPVPLEIYADVNSPIVEDLEKESFFNDSLEPEAAEELNPTPTFNLPIDEEPLLPTVEEVNNTPIVSIPVPIVIPDDDDLPQQPAIEESKVEELPAEVSNEVNIAPTYEIPTIEPEVKEENSLPPVEELNLEPVIEEPKVEELPVEVSNEVNMEPTYEIPTIEPEVKEEISLPPVEELNLEPVIEEPKVEELPVEVSNEVNITPTYETPTIEPEVKEESTDESSIQINEVKNDSLPSIEELKKEAEESLQEPLVRQPYEFEPQGEPSLESMGLSKEALEPKQTTQAKFDIDKVTSEINKCKEILEGIGLNVRLEEFDFEDMYQVIISINK